MNSPTPCSRRAFLALAAGLPILAAAGAAHADETGDALAAVTKARAGLTSLSAKFTQLRKISIMKKEVKSEGELTVVMPDKLRWDLTSEGVTYWVSSTGVAYKTKESPKPTQAPAGAFGQLLPDLIAFLGGDIAKLRSSYDITASQAKEGNVTIVAVPTSAALKDVVKKITLRTNPERWGVEQVIIEEKKDRSTIDFQANARNPKVPKERMTPG